jgi:hypothetical protein
VRIDPVRIRATDPLEVCPEAMAKSLPLQDLTNLSTMLLKLSSCTVSFVARIAQSKDKRAQLIVWCEKVPNPVAVRYASSNLPVGGLMNGRELPAFPFRSDNWPITPHQSTGSYERTQESN